MAATSEYKYAGFWWRFLAAIIDSLILTVANIVLGFIIGFVMGMSGLDVHVIRVLVNILAIIWNWLYFALFESSPWRATIGKRVCGLIVVDMDGHQISFGRATGRYFGKILSTLILFVGFMMAGWTAKKQALHDKIAHCLVLKRLGKAADIVLPSQPTEAVG